MMDENWLQKEYKIFLIVVESVQLLGGIALLIQVIYTWLKMLKLNILIKFMKILLMMVLIKSISQISESIELLIHKEKLFNEPRNLIFTAICELINWVST